jgi:carbohydrate-selective porin OprB
MKKSLTYSLLFLAFSAGVLRSESDNSPEKWWNGKRGTGDWFGARPALEDRGIKLTGKWIGTFYGVAAGGLDQRGTFDQSLHFEI